MGDPGNNTWSLWEVSADGRNLHPLLRGWNSPPEECCGSWTRDGKYFLFQSLRNGPTNIWAMREKGNLFRKPNREPVQLTSGPMNFYAVEPSVDAQALGWRQNTANLSPRGATRRSPSGIVRRSPRRPQFNLAA